MGKSESLVLNVPEAGKLLNVSRATAYDLARRGILPTLRLGPRRIVVPRRALERLLDEATSATGQGR